MGINSFAFGKNGYAKGNYSVAMGNQCTAKANFSFALGNGCNSDGVNSFAMGLRSNTNLKNGSFVISDNSSYLINSSSSDNQIRLRFSGDTTLTGNFAYEFYTDPSCSIGVKLEPYGSGWSTLSSRSYKENLQIIDYNELLEQFNNIDVFNWNYINSPNKTQYIGPVAQDFFKTFKIGYDSNYINSINIDGVNMAAIKGLYIKNSELKKVLDSLKLYLSDVVNKLNNAIILMSKNELQSTHIIEDATFHLNVYPNPTNVKSGIKVEYQLPSGSELCNIKIYDVLNRELLAFNNLKMGGLSVIDLSLNTFVKGSYKCVLFCGGNKMLIENFIVGE